MSRIFLDIGMSGGYLDNLLFTLLNSTMKTLQECIVFIFNHYIGQIFFKNTPKTLLLEYIVFISSYHDERIFVKETSPRSVLVYFWTLEYLLRESRSGIILPFLLLKWFGTDKGSSLMELERYNSPYFLWIYIYCMTEAFRDRRISLLITAFRNWKWFGTLRGNSLLQR